MKWLRPAHRNVQHSLAYSSQEPRVINRSGDTEQWGWDMLIPRCQAWPGGDGAGLIKLEAGSPSWGVG